ncbi:hypothetical protein GMRT_10485 [Giardia muris]|uniref:Uncharacterized protein n=1 Tax=Giardia muris TaxID=5742 RepID=A0A4Z1SLK0_GIAMU|nr:hypothetical protein GMRT_10485 [Giardia muris]|eukprot:TNJ26524.1 hypothetical protein GMRT_10485 [Giardia muris]
MPSGLQSHVRGRTRLIVLPETSPSIQGAAWFRSLTAIHGGTILSHQLGFTGRAFTFHYVGREPVAIIVVTTLQILYSTERTSIGLQKLFRKRTNVLTYLRTVSDPNKLSMRLAKLAVSRLPESFASAGDLFQTEYKEAIRIGVLFLHRLATQLSLDADTKAPTREEVLETLRLVVQVDVAITSQAAMPEESAKSMALRCGSAGITVLSLPPLKELRLSETTESSIDNYGLVTIRLDINQGPSGDQYPAQLYELQEWPYNDEAHIPIVLAQTQEFRITPIIQSIESRSQDFRLKLTAFQRPGYVKLQPGTKTSPKTIWTREHICQPLANVGYDHLSYLALACAYSELQSDMTGFPGLTANERLALALCRSHLCMHVSRVGIPLGYLGDGLNEDRDDKRFDFRPYQATLLDYLVALSATIYSNTGDYLVALTSGPGLFESHGNLLSFSPDEKYVRFCLQGLDTTSMWLDLMRAEWRSYVSLVTEMIAEPNVTIDTRTSKSKLMAGSHSFRTGGPLTGKERNLKKTLQERQQLIVYDYFLAKRFTLTTGWLTNTLVRLGFNTVFVLSIEGAVITADKEHVALLVLVEDIGLPLTRYVADLRERIHLQVKTNPAIPSKLWPQTSVYHCLLGCTLAGRVCCYQPLLLTGLRRCYSISTTGAISSIGPESTRVYSALETSVAFGKACPIYTGPLIVGSYSHLLSSVSCLASANETSVLLCLRSLHVLLIIDLESGEKQLIGPPIAFNKPFSGRSVATNLPPCALFEGLKQIPVVPGVEHSSGMLVGYASDYSDTDEMRDSFRNAGSDQEWLERQKSIVMCEDSDEVVIPGFTDPSDTDAVSVRQVITSDTETRETTVHIACQKGRDWKQARTFRSHPLMESRSIEEMNIRVSSGNGLQAWVYTPLAVQLLSFRGLIVLAAIGLSPSLAAVGYIYIWHCAVNELTIQAIIDLGVVPLDASCLGSRTIEATESDDGRCNSSSIASTHDSFIFSVPCLIKDNTNAIHIPGIRLVEVGVYGEIRQAFETRGSYRCLTPNLGVKRRLQPLGELS